MAGEIYSSDGVNVDLGDSASKFAAKVCQASYTFSPIANVVDTSNGNFRGPRAIQLKPEFDSSFCFWSCAPDGIGTKVVLTDAVGTHILSAYDLLAMTSFDLVRWGGIPVYMTSVLDVSSLGESIESPTYNAVLNLYAGLLKAAEKSGIIVLNGETAELSSLVSSENPNATLMYNWGASVHGLFHPDKMITGGNIEEGNIVIAFKENGFRSNGISSVRKAFKMKFGDNWFNKQIAFESIMAAAVPSILYDRVFVDANGWLEDERIDIKGIVHVTGGSFESKLGDLLYRKGLSAYLYDLYPLPDIMRQCADWREMTDRDLYKTWNAGQGALAIVDKNDVDILLSIAEKHNIDAKVCGEITKRDFPSITIISKYKGGLVEFN